MAMAGPGFSSASGSASEDLWEEISRPPKRLGVNSLPRKSRIPSVEEVSTKEEPKWTTHSGAQNLATALNDPSCRELDLFTRTWGSYFIPMAPLPHSTLPSIELRDFLRYLKDTARGRKVHRAIMRDLKKQSESTTPTSPAVIAPLVAKLNEGGKTYDLSTVPRVFMQTDFSLEDLPTFQEVIPFTQLLSWREGGGAKPQNSKQKGGAGIETVVQVNQSSKLLHEKLTHFLDIIEVHLAYQISQRSDLFFETLSSQQDLQSLMTNARHEVVELRHKVRQLDKVSTHETLRSLRAFIHYRRCSQVIDKLKLISIVQQTQPNIQSLLATSDFVGALELISTTQEVLSQELQGVHALRHLSSQLTEMEKAIGKMMEGDFVQFCLDDIRQRIKEPAGGGADSTETEERLISVTFGLLRQGKVHFLTALRDSLLSFLKLQVKAIVNDYLNLSCKPREEMPSMSEAMRELNFDPWMALLSHVFECLINHIAAVQASVRVIAGVCERAVGSSTVTVPVEKSPTPEPIAPPTDAPPPSLSYTPVESLEAQEAEDRLEQMLLDDELSDTRLGLSLTTEMVASSQLVDDSIRSKLEVQDSKTVAMTTAEEATVDLKEETRLKNDSAGSEGAVISHDLSHTLLAECEEVLSASCDLIHSRCAKILTIRAKVGLLEDLLPLDFVSLVRLVEKFVSQSSKLIGRECPQLRSALLSQAKKFLEHSHNQTMSKLSLLLDGERWKQADVPAEIQFMATRIETGIPPPSGGEDRSLKLTGTQPPSNKLFIHGQQFAVVGVVLLLIQMVMYYCSHADDLPMLITDILSRLVEVFKKFNSRTCDLVLGAGAMNAVGLKMITARHLALSTRCLEAVMLIIPDVKRHFQIRLPPKQHVLLSQFDQVIEDISSHCQRTNVKVMNIMDTMILKQLDKWEAKSPVPSVPFKNLIKQIVKLHDNLVDILPPEQLQALFVGIERIFTGHLREKLLLLGISNNGSTQHGIVNSELSHFKGSLSSLEDVRAFGSSLFDVWTGLR